MFFKLQEIKMNSNLHSVEIDPLATFDYPQYSNYPQQPYPSQYQNTYNYDLKIQYPINCNKEDIHTKDIIDVKENSNVKENVDQNKQTKVKKETKGRERKSFLSEKIADSDFPFYGCAVCNISFKLLSELDKHITTHKDRITSYGLRLKNQLKRKKMRKEQKKLKKLKKSLKKMQNGTEIDIKPEDGYIGNTKTVDYKQNEVENKLDSKLTEVKENSTKDEPQKDNNLEKMFKCFACQKQFTLSYYLKLHVRSHTGKLEY